MKNTALTQTHINLGAKMAEFAGYNMPIQYSGLIDEHLCVREKLGVFDVSHMGEFLVEGPKALALIQEATSNDASKLSNGKVQYSCLPNQKGGIVDDLLVYRFTEDKYLLVVNASNIEKDFSWISKINQKHEAKLTNISDEISLLAVQGPLAINALQSLTSVNLSEISYYSFVVGSFASVDDVIISATGYTGSGGFELYFKNKDAQTMWDAVIRAGEPFGIQPVGLGARDTLRLEKGFCLYGNDIDDTTSPIEAGLSWITKFTKEFTCSKILEEQKKNGVKRTLVGFELMDKGIPRHAYEVCDESGKQIGIVTSGTMSPSLKKAIGLAYVPKEKAVLGSKIFIKVRDKLLKAEVCKLPFV